MGAHDRVRVLRLHPVGAGARFGAALGVALRRAGARRHAVGLYRLEPFQHRLHPVRKGLIGEVLVGEQRVAAERRHVQGDQDGAHRRFRDHYRVGVPVLADDACVARIADDGHDVGIVGDQERVLEDIAESSRQALMRIGVEILVAEEDDAMVEQGAPDRADFILA